MIEPWQRPFVHQKLGEHQEVPAGKNHPYFNYDAVNWEKAAKALHGLYREAVFAAGREHFLAPAQIEEAIAAAIAKAAT